jgi:Nitrile hydratase beta subunit
VIPIETGTPLAPPRVNGELVFDAPWQARAFGMAVALLERQELGWDVFRRHLVSAIDAHPEAPYYYHFVDALAALADQVAGTQP